LQQNREFVLNNLKERQPRDAVSLAEGGDLFARYLNRQGAFHAEVYHASAMARQYAAGTL